MIDVVFVRKGLHVVAYHINQSNGSAYLGVGFTQRGAMKHLVRSIESDVKM